MQRVSERQFSCACGADVDLEMAFGADATALINEHMRTGTPPVGLLSLTVSQPTPLLYASGPSLVYVPRDSPPAPPPAPEPERVISGSVIGYRAWRIKDWQLTGTGVNRAWHPGVNEATCDVGNRDDWRSLVRPPHRHPAPRHGCHCGITALARFSQGDAHWTNVDVFGAIEAWSDETPDSEPGRFILHGNGFRAQFGKVILLAVDDDWPAAKRAAVRALAAEHDADVCQRSHLEDAAKEHGQLVPDEWLAWAGEGDSIPPGVMSRYQQQVIALQQAFASGTQQAMTLQHALDRLGAVAQTKPELVRKGIRHVIGYPGPPSHGKYRTGDRVRDRARTIWVCSRGGQPGVWEQERA